MRTLPSLARDTRALILAIVVAVVLADSSIVILALPAVINEYTVDIPTVAWVLTSFNLVLAISAVPAAYIARRNPRSTLIVGLIVFAVASAACAFAPSFEILLVARCLQAVGGAAVVCAALDVMPAVADSPRDAIRLWAIAGAVGLALGPALGGTLTQLLSWRAIFIAQVPIILAILVVRGVHVTPTRQKAGRPHLGANVALMLVSAGLTTALFLLVLLMINGWGMEPLVAAVAVSVMPIAAIAAERLDVFRVGPWARAFAGAVAVACGVGALGLMPRVGVFWTAIPQVLVGAGLGLAVGALTELALAHRPVPAIHGGWTVAFRHLGVVAGILILTPVFVADFDRQQRNAEDAVLSVALDAPVNLSTKLVLMSRGVEAVNQAVERIPDLDPVFASVQPDPDDRRDVNQLKDRLNDELRRASTNAVVRSFLYGSLFGLLALIPIGLAWRRSTQ